MSEFIEGKVRGQKKYSGNGVVFAISDELKLPVRYIGVGEAIDDLKPFVAKDFIDALFDK